MESSPRLLIGVALATALLGGCNAFDRLSNVGEKPALTPIENPLSAPGYHPVSLPMPPPQVAERMPNSLWRTGSRTFFRDLRATRVDGHTGGAWVVLDFFDVIVHVMRSDVRERYDLESLWGDAAKVKPAKNLKAKKTRAKK